MINLFHRAEFKPQALLSKLSYGSDLRSGDSVFNIIISIILLALTRIIANVNEYMQREYATNKQSIFTINYMTALIICH